MTDPARGDWWADDPAQIHAQIDQTRSRMDRTLDELAQRLRPARLARDVACSALQSMIGRSSSGGGGPHQSFSSPGAGVSGVAASVASAAFSSVAKPAAQAAGRKTMETFSKHPLSSLLITAGVAWLIAEHFRGHRDRADAYDAYDPDDYAASHEAFDEGAGESAGESITGRMRETADRMTDRARRSADAVADSARHAADTVKHKTEEAREAARRGAEMARRRLHDTRDYLSSTAGEVSHRAYDAIAHAGETLQHQTARAREQVTHGLDVATEKSRQTFEAHPLCVGCAVLAAGVLAGLALPASRKEDELLGETRDHLTRGLRQQAGHLWERGQEIADAAVDEVRRQGLMPGQIKDTMAHAASDTLKEKAGHVAQAAKDAATEGEKEEKETASGESRKR